MALSARTVHERLNESARRLRWSRSGRYLLLGLAVSLAFLMVGLLLDARLHFGFTGRWVVFTLIIGPVLATLVLAARTWIVPISEQAIARRIEVACENSQNVLISAVQFDRELPANSPLRQALFQEMTDPFPRVSWKSVFDLKLIVKLGAALGLVLVAMLVWAIISPDRFANSAARLLLPASSVAPLTQTRIIEIGPGNATVVHGSEFKTTAKLGGVLPRAAWVHFREPGSSWQKSIMNREVGEPLFTFRWKEITQPFEYYVEAGDTRSALYRINVRPRTAIRSRSAEMETPPYTKLGRLSVKDFSALQNVFPGSKITVTLEFNYPLSALEVTDDKNAPLPVKKLEDTRWQFEVAPKVSQTLKLTYHDKDRYSDHDTLPIAIKPDDPPKIIVNQPAEGQQLLGNRDGTLDVVFTCTDNFGLGSVALYRMTTEARDGQLIQEWKDVAGQLSFSASTKVSLANYATENDDRLTFFVVAKDQNDVTGPGVTFSRPLVVTLRSPDEVKQQTQDTATKFQKSLEDLIRLQQTNLDESRAVARMTPPPAAAFSPLLERQVEIGALGANLANTAAMISGDIRAILRRLSEVEMKEAILALRNATTATGEPQMKFLARAIELESLILAKLQGSPQALKEELAKAQVQDMLAGLEELLRSQRDLQRDTQNATESVAATLSERQDKLADRSLKVRDGLQKSLGTAPLGDKGLIERLTKIVAMFGELRINEDMLTAAEQIGNKRFSDAVAKQQEVINNLTKMIQMLNEARLAHGIQEVENIRKTLDEMKEKLAKLENIQREILEKSKDVAKKDETNPEDVAQGDEIRQSKDLMKQVVEQMLLDAHVLPDLNPANELRSTLLSITEEVKQADEEAAKKGELKETEIAVQKEDWILQALEKAQERLDDMENWLPDKTDTAKWLCENFDKAEMPQVPNVPLPDAFDDLVGELQKEQQDMAEKANDANSNQLFAQIPAGWDVADGPQASFGAQGKSGNQRPNKNEQTGRSSGGRQGMSSGEMAGDTTTNLEGSEVDTRRTKDQAQKGMVKDGGGPSEAKATGGGKAGAFSDRKGMDGTGPVRESNAPRQFTNDAMAVQQALLAEKTSKMYAQAKLLFLKTGNLPEVVRLMDESQQALQQGRMRDFAELHRKIIAELNVVKGQLRGSSIVSLSGADNTRLVERQLAGGDEGAVPPQYKEMVADYYRSLSEVR